MAILYLYECAGCGQYHPLGFAGDCRNDDMRLAAPPLGAFVMDEDAPIPPRGVVPREGVEVGCGDPACVDCYEAEDDSDDAQP